MDNLIKYIKNNSIESQILIFFLSQETAQVSDVFEFLLNQKNDISLITIKRALSKMSKNGFLERTGYGRATKYQISTFGKLGVNIDPQTYCAEEPDKRFGAKNFNFDLFDKLPKNLFSKEELKKLEEATFKYSKKILNVSETIHQQELERFIIELSWKSSKIEGNTYTLLDTEKLLKEGILAEGKSKQDATMIINHKKAFDFILNHKNDFKEINISKIENVHKILIENLGVKNNLRAKPVGILGSKYLPLDNQFQIREALESLCEAVNKMTDPYSKTLMIILGISYIQPFEDGNKRTSRLIGNALLLAYGFAPLSYRIVDEEKYREAVLVFYELNSAVPFKNIFIDQYLFSVENYLI
jgi:Fic family protein